MGLRRWFFDMLMRGTPPAHDPTELVEVATLPLFDATLLTETLRTHGVGASCLETVSVVTRSITHGRIMVPRAQFDEARKLVDTP
jgi:hypothetical protein